MPCLQITTLTWLMSFVSQKLLLAIWLCGLTEVIHFYFLDPTFFFVYSFSYAQTLAVTLLLLLCCLLTVLLLKILVPCILFVVWDVHSLCLFMYKYKFSTYLTTVVIVTISYLGNFISQLVLLPFWLLTDGFVLCYGILIFGNRGNQHNVLLGAGFSIRWCGGS